MVTNQFPNILYAMVNGTFVPVATLTLTDGGQLVITPSSGGGGGGGYVLPVATTTVLGGVKQGNNVTIDASGVLSVAPPGTGTVDSIVQGGGILVDATDPINPEVSVTADPSIVSAWINAANGPLGIFVADATGSLSSMGNVFINGVAGSAGNAAFILTTLDTMGKWAAAIRQDGVENYAFILNESNLGSNPFVIESGSPDGIFRLNAAGTITSQSNRVVVALDDATTPTNPVTPTGWIKTAVSGVDSWLPYYQ